MQLERLCANRSKEHAIQPKRSEGSARHSQMAQMRRVEAAAEEGNARASALGPGTRFGHGIAHGFMVSRAPADHTALVASDSRRCDTLMICCPRLAWGGGCWRCRVATPPVTSHA